MTGRRRLLVLAACAAGRAAHRLVRRDPVAGAGGRAGRRLGPARPGRRGAGRRLPGPAAGPAARRRGPRCWPWSSSAPSATAGRGGRRRPRERRWSASCSGCRCRGCRPRCGSSRWSRARRAGRGAGQRPAAGPAGRGDRRRPADRAARARWRRRRRRRCPRRTAGACSRCSCGPTGPGWTALATRPGVRAVQAAPPGVTARELALAPLLPEQTLTRRPGARRRAGAAGMRASRYPETRGQGHPRVDWVVVLMWASAAAWEGGGMTTNRATHGAGTQSCPDRYPQFTRVFPGCDRRSCSLCGGGTAHGDL